MEKKQIKKEQILKVLINIEQLLSKGDFLKCKKYIEKNLEKYK